MIRLYIYLYSNNNDKIRNVETSSKKKNLVLNFIIKTTEKKNHLNNIKIKKKTQLNELLKRIIYNIDYILVLLAFILFIVM